MNEFELKKERKERGCQEMNLWFPVSMYRRHNGNKTLQRKKETKRL